MCRSEKYRQKKEIEINGIDVAPLRKFKSFFKEAVPEKELQKLLSSLYKKPTPIQAQAVPTILTGRDVLCCSPTGTGKTLSFLIPIFKSFFDSKAIAANKEKIQVGSLIVSPTKELAFQTHAVARRLNSRLKICLLSKKNLDGLKSVDILVATPLSLVSNKQVFCFLSLRHLVVDEIDRLFDLPALVKQLDQIFSFIPPTTQKMFFSATITKNAEELSKSVMTDPVEIFVGKKNTPVKRVSHRFVFVGSKEGKIAGLKNVVCEGLNPPVLVFTNSTQKAEEVYNFLQKEGYPVGLVHGKKAKGGLVETMKAFRKGEILFLITTDILARGIDFTDVGCVLSYDCPETLEVHIHRVGRTARCGKKGDAVVLFQKGDKKKLSRISKAIKKNGGDIPGWMVEE